MELLLILKFLISFLISFYLLPKLIRISNHYHIHDVPDERKNHVTPVPFLGGVALYIGFHLTQHFNSLLKIETPQYMELFGFCIVGNLLIGLGDDFFDYNPTRKFLVQFLLCGTLFYFSRLSLPFVSILPFLHAIPYANTSLTILVFMGIINAYNLIDGMDGLAASLTLISATAFLLLFYVDGNIYFQSLVLAISGGLIAFLFYNRPKAMIFLGDNGSFMLGTILGVLTINYIIGNESITPVNDRFQFAFSLVAIPTVDMVRLFLWRILQRKSPFVGDNLHIHHLLQKVGYTVKQTLMWITFSQLILFILAFAFQGKNSFLYFLAATIVVYLLVIIYLKKKIGSKTGSAGAEHTHQIV
jgi:UDP-GlcNAc:undecaprenyl-phosphate GlcNAc-1-phosphate transferase